MLLIDGNPVDMTNPSSWGGSIKLKPGGLIEQSKDGVKTRVEAHQPWCQLTSSQPQPAKCNCKGD
jgi:hypothetical protein